MKVQIIGGGSVGLLVASFLQQSRLNVTLVVRREEQLQRLQIEGLTRVNLSGERVTMPIQVTQDICEDVDLTILTTKSYELASLFEQLEKLPQQMSLLFMQNGLAHFIPALSLPQQHIAFASVQFGAKRESDTVVSHKGVGIFKLAVEKGEQVYFYQLLQAHTPYFPIELVDDAYMMLVEKALLNCFINPMTAILQVSNGALLSNPAAYQLLQQLYVELIDVFPAFQEEFPFDSVVSLCKKTAQNTSSMLMDRINERQSEVDAILVPIIDEADKLGKKTPTLSTLYYLVKALEMERETK